MARLFTPLTLRGSTFANRCWVSPMCQYSATEGEVGDWHLVHLGALAVGRPGLLMAEATAVEPIGRITPGCAGIWSENHIRCWRRIVDFAHASGTPIGLQISHAGRKGSTSAPWHGGAGLCTAEGGWTPVAPSAIAYGRLPIPRELTEQDLIGILSRFEQGALNAAQAGFDVLELHMAHGYLLHQFLSPLSNLRVDRFGGDLDGRVRFPLMVAERVRSAWPDDRPMFVRVSATDWVDGGWTVAETIELVTRLSDVGVDLVDVSSGGLSPTQAIPPDIDYQVSIAGQIRSATDVAISAVGLITNPWQAESILQEGAADAVVVARQFLRDPHFALRCARELGADAPWPNQYARALPWN